MAKPMTPRRVRVERGIYRRSTGVLEVGFKDETGRQRWRTVDGGILPARNLRDDLSAKRARGESVSPKPRLRFDAFVSAHGGIAGGLAGESVDEVAFLLGHRDGNVTRAVYVREVADARRRAMRRSRMNAEFGAVLNLALATE